MSSQNRNHIQSGFTIIEVLTVLALMGIIMLMSVGVLSSRRNQKALLQSGRQFANDVRAAVEVSKSRSKKLYVEVTDKGWNIYIEQDDPANGWQEGEERILSYSLPKGTTITAAPAIPDEWNKPDELKAGDLFTIDALGLHAQKIIRFNYPEAPIYQSVCVRLFDSGDAEVYRYSGGNTWTLAPLG